MAGGPVQRKGRNERASTSPQMGYKIIGNKAFDDFLANSCWIQLDEVVRKKMVLRNL